MSIVGITATATNGARELSDVELDEVNGGFLALVAVAVAVGAAVYGAAALGWAIGEATSNSTPEVKNLRV